MSESTLSRSSEEGSLGFTGRRAVWNELPRRVASDPFESVAFCVRSFLLLLASDQSLELIDREIFCHPRLAKERGRGRESPAEIFSDASRRAQRRPRFDDALSRSSPSYSDSSHDREAMLETVRSRRRFGAAVVVLLPRTLSCAALDPQTLAHLLDLPQCASQGVTT